jgi:hypothetical protein
LFIPVFFLDVTIFIFMVRLGDCIVQWVIIVAGLIFKGRHLELFTTFGHWMGLGWLHGHLLQKTGNSYCTVTAIRKSVTCPVLDRQTDLPGTEDTNLEAVHET